MKLVKLTLPALALGATAMLLTPRETEAFNLLGGSLGLSQRDFRVFNNFVDASANNNQVYDSRFPGHQGAVMAIWKGCVEWGSEWHGDGEGDPYQGNKLGSGQANFDPSFQGEALGVGGTDSNIHSALSGGSGGVLAFCETPISNGWRIRYYESWTWADGPGSSGTDIQGIACHEYGHALGLAHSNNSSATMWPSATGNGAPDRSISSDDVLGIQAIYGVKSASKPRITDVSVDTVLDTVTITGVNFAATNNEVWFTQGTAGGNGTPTKSLGVVATSGGTEITIPFPSNSGPGDVLVKIPGTGHDKLSNAWPVDPDGIIPPVDPNDPPSITSIAPASVEAVRVDPDVFFVSINGANLNNITGVEIDGVPHSSWSSTSSQVLISNFPMVSTIGPVDIELLHPSGNAVTQIMVDINDPPVIEVYDSVPDFAFSFEGLRVDLGSKPGDVMILGFSGSNVPSNLPGYVNFAIGNNFSQLGNLGAYLTPISGFTHLDIPLTGNFAGVRVYFQAAFIDSDGLPTIYPLGTTNVQEILFVF